MSLECYWKLVSAEPGERTRAAHDLIAGLREDATKAEAGQPLPASVDYAVKRLVRGLSSSTEAARQGFAACLAELLATLPQVPLSVVREHMLASTEVTGSVRGQEERDLLLGRLFTCLAVARSGRLSTTSDKEWDVGQELLETALPLFAKRKVLRSLAAEAVVALVEQMPPSLFCSSAATSKLGAALGAGQAGGDAKGDDEDEDGDGNSDGAGDLPLEELNPDQLGVALAVQAYLRRQGLGKKSEALTGKLPRWLLSSKRLLRAKHAGKLLEPLKASSAAFPQVHPVWGRILDELLPAAAAAEAATDKEEGDEAAFQALWAVVVDGALASGTHERKALAMMLLQRAVPRAPAGLLPFCLSPQVLRVLLAALCTAGSGDAILKPLAQQTLDALVALGEGRPQVRLALAGALLTRCDVQFDLKTGTKTVQSLLEGLAAEDLLAFLQSLATAFEETDSAPAPVAAEDGEEREGDDAAAAAAAAEGATLARRVWVVDALYALSKSPALAVAAAGKAEAEAGGAAGVLRQVLRLLLAWAYFDMGGFDAAAAGGSSGGKKGKKGAKASSKKGGGGDGCADEDGPASSWVLTTAAVPLAARRVAAARFHSLLADLGKRGGASAPLRWEAGGDAPSGEPGALGWLWAAHSAWAGLEAHGAVLVAPLDEEGRAAREAMLSLVGRIKGEQPQQGGAEEKMSAAFAALIMQIGLQQLRVAGEGAHAHAGEEEDEAQGDMLGDLCRCYEDLMAKRQQKEKEKEKGKGGSKKRKKAADEEEEEVDAMAVLADVCVGALSSAREGVAVRGLREVIRRAWGLVCASCPLTRPALDVLLGVVCKAPAGDEEAEEDEEEGDGSGSGSESGSDGEEDANALAALDRALKSVGVPAESSGSDDGAKGEGDEDDDDDDDEEEEEIVVDGKDRAAFLRVLGGEDEHQAHLQHMLHLKQQSRQGSRDARLERERAALQHRLRALDLLEVAAAKQDTSPLLLLAIRPSLRAIRRLQAQAGPGKPAETVALAQRLSDFLAKRLAKARPKLAAAEDEEEAKAIVQAILGDLRKAPSGQQASLLVGCLTVCTRAVLAAAAAAAATAKDQKKKDGSSGGGGGGGGAAAATAPEWLAQAYQEALAEFMTKRTALTAAPFEQLVARFPSPACVVLLPALNRHAVAADKAFRQAEAFRLAGLLLGQRKVLAPEAAAKLQAELGPLLEGLTSVLEAGGAELKGKRLKPLVDCCQAAALALKDAAAAGAGASGGKGKGKGTHTQQAQALGEVLLRVRESTGSDALKKLCAGVAKQLGVAAADAVNGGDAGAGAGAKATKKEKKQQKKDAKRPREEPAEAKASAVAAAAAKKAKTKAKAGEQAEPKAKAAAVAAEANGAGGKRKKHKAK